MYVTQSRFSQEQTLSGLLLFAQFSSHVIKVKKKKKKKHTHQTPNTNTNTNTHFIYTTHITHHTKLGLPGLIGASPYAETYDKQPWISGTFYTSKLTSGKETTLSALSELLKSTAVVVDQIDSRTEDILTKVRKII